MSPPRPGRRRSRRHVSLPPSPGKPRAAAPGGARPGEEGARKDPLLGKVVGRCRIQELIGQGRTARVYRAEHEALHTTVAIKILLPRSAANPEIVEKFQSEARAIAKIDNENVLKIYDVGSEGKLHYLVMELLDGEEVLDILNREERFEVMDAMRVTRQAANGLAAAHAQGIVHRDVKPQNLVLLENGTVKVVDFGLASVAQPSGGRVGTPHFMAPETCESGEATAKSDIYSLGVTLYYMLVGKAPYAGQDVPSILKSHIRGEPLHPEKKRPSLPDEASELVRRLTPKDAATRPTATQVVEAIDGFGGDAMQEKATLRRRRHRRRRRVRAHAAAAPQRSSSAPLVVAVLVVIGIIAAIIAFGSSGKDEPSPPPRPKETSATTDPGVTPPAVPTQPTPPDRPSVPTPPRDPAPPAEDDAETAANKALFEAEQWARRNWKTSDDDDQVVGNYEKLVKDFPKTSAAAEAATRIRGIKAGELHPHPDKSYSKAQDIESAKAAWNDAQPKVEEAIGRHAYVTAKGFLPMGVQDGRGTFGKDIAFWRGFLTHLILFKSSLGTWAPKLIESKRTIETAKGTGLVKKMTAQHLTVRIDGMDQKVLWTEVEPKVLASLGRTAFQEAPGATGFYTMGFTFAHGLWEAFWEADFDLGMTDGVDTSDFMIREYKRRVDARKAVLAGGR